MKQLLTIILISLISVLIGCTSKNNSDKKQENQSAVGEKQEKIDNKEKVVNSETPLEIKLDYKLNNGKVYFYGNTNLPNNTKLGLSVRNNNGYHAQDFDIKVRDGNFQSTGFTNKGSKLSGVYQVELISHFSSFWQSEELLKQLNFFRGKFIKEKKDKRIIKLQKNIEIGDKNTTSTNTNQSDFEKIKKELIGKKYTYPFSFKVVIEKYGQPETISESTTNEKWVAYFPKGNFTLVTKKSTDEIIAVYKGKQTNL